MKTKVLFLPDWYPSETDKLYGIFVQEHVKAAQLYDDVAVLHGVNSSSLEKSPFFWKSLEEGVPTFRFRIPKAKIPKTGLFLYILTVIKAFRLLQKEWGTPQVIHAQEPQSALIALILKKIYGIPFVVSEHSSHFSKRTLPPFPVRLARLAYPRASRILGANNKFPADFQFYSIDCDFRWLPNAMDPTIFYASERERDFLVLHCSLFDKKKRVSDLIKAFSIIQKDFPKLRLELIGDGLKRREAEELANELLISGSFVFHGIQPKEFIAEAMRKARVFVLPSDSENLPCVLIEAMGCGAPVVATRVGDIDHIVGERQGILVEPGDVSMLAKSIGKVLTQPQLYNYKEIALYALTNFSRQSIGRILHEEHLRAVIDGNRIDDLFGQIDSQCRI
jgi:glycosyltransferase involved in cell wall biosynthesis